MLMPYSPSDVCVRAVRVGPAQLWSESRRVNIIVHCGNIMTVTVVITMHETPLIGVAREDPSRYAMFPSYGGHLRLTCV